MKRLLAVIGGCMAASLMLMSALAQSAGNKQDPTMDPKYLRLVDLAKCSLEVGEIERVEKVQLGNGETLVPSRRDAQLTLIQLKGTASELGRISLNPRLFGVNYVWRGFLKLSLARGLGFRGKTPEGQPLEIWHCKSEESVNHIVQAQGDAFNFWIAVETPKDVQEVFVRFPAVIHDPMRMPAPKGE